MKARLLFPGINTLLSFVLVWLFLSFFYGDQQRSDSGAQEQAPVLFQSAAPLPKNEVAQEVETLPEQQKELRSQPEIQSDGLSIGLLF